MKPNQQKLLRSKSTYKEDQVTVTEDFELQYNKEHIVEKVKVGETDLVKEVASHIDEVGLINVIRNAIARGEDPAMVFGKTEPGVMSSISPNATKDEIEQEIANMSNKKAEIAKTLGVSVAELDAALKSGSLDSLIAGNNQPAASTEGGEE